MAILVLVVAIWGLVDLGVSLREWEEECQGLAWVALGWVVWGACLAVWVVWVVAWAVWVVAWALA